jgi:TonB-dependent starch-binding outer membrane protein SusC
MKGKLAWVLIFVLSSLTALSQRTVTGKVTRENGEPLAGATVTLKGTRTAARTGSDGNFSISVPNNNARLVISFVGTATQEITVGTQTAVNVTMREEASTLTDVVVIGYQTVRRKDLLASVSSVSAKDLKDIPINNAAEALNGRLAGVTATTAEGSPDADVRIRVRGGISITQDNSPLYIVDGVQMENAFNTISPQDIQTIDVLKDAAATAIYGARGANGVIVITTKAGRPGKLVVSYNALAGLRFLARKLDVLDPYDFVVYAYERSRGNSQDSANFREDFGTNFDTLKNYRNQEFVDWQEEVMGRTGFQTTHNISVSGGNKKLTYNVGYTHNTDRAIVLNSRYIRNLFNVKADYKITPKIKLAVGGRYNLQDVYGAGVSSETGSSFNRLRNAVKYRPFLSQGQDVDDQDPFADPNVGNNLSLTNPIALANAEYRKKSTNAYNANASISINLTKNLTFKSTVGYDFSKLVDRQFSDSITPYATTQGGRKPIISLDTLERKGFTNSNVLTWSLKNFREKHDFDVLVGQETVELTSELHGRTVRDFAQGTSPHGAFGNHSAGTVVLPIRYTEFKSTLLSFFGRVNYGFMDKYLFSMNLRADGSSKFAPGKQWGYFPAGSVAWRISREKFMENVDWITDLKLRAGFGTSGNNRIADYLFLTTFRFDQFIYGLNGQAVTAATSSSLVNQNLKWESTVSRNFGLDATLFNSKLDISVDVYKNNSKDLLLNVPVASTFGYSTQIQNVGKTESRGLEFQISSTLLKRKNNLNWTANFNMSFNRNVVKNLGYQQFFHPAPALNLSGQPADYITRVGDPVGAMYGWVTDGFYRVEDFYYDAAARYHRLKPGVVDMTPVTNYAVPGGIKFKDISGPNGKPDGVVNDFDRQIIGDPTPKFTGGLNQQFTYKQWDASVFVNFSFGNDIYNANKIEMTNGYSINSNMLEIMRDRWKTIDENGRVLQYIVGIGGTNYPLIVDSAKLSAVNAAAAIWQPLRSTGAFFPHSWAIEDGSFVRLNNVTIGYSVPARALVKLRMSKLRFYVTGNNLAIITNYSGYDPEVSVRSNPLTPGFDYSAYPKSRSFIIGANVTF